MAFKFEDLNIWKESVKFAHEIYVITKRFPRTELFGLTNQLNRAATSISLNIAEGEGRHSDADLSRFIQIAIGSLFVCLYKRCEQISKMLHAFRNYLKKDRIPFGHRP